MHFGDVIERKRPSPSTANKVRWFIGLILLVFGIGKAGGLFMSNINWKMGDPVLIWVPHSMVFLTAAVVEIAVGLLMEPARFVERGVAALARAGIPTASFPPEYVAAALETAREKGKLFKDLPAFVDFYFAPDDAVPVEPETRAKALSAAARLLLEKLDAAFATLSEFQAPALEATLKALAAELGVKVGALVQPVLAACTGKLVGPSLYHLLEVLGRERVQRRFAVALSQVPQA